MCVCVCCGSKRFSIKCVLNYYWSHFDAHYDWVVIFPLCCERFLLSLCLWFVVVSVVVIYMYVHGFFLLLNVLLFVLVIFWCEYAALLFIPFRFIIFVHKYYFSALYGTETVWTSTIGLRLFFFAVVIIVCACGEQSTINVLNCVRCTRSLIHSLSLSSLLSIRTREQSIEMRWQCDDDDDLETFIPLPLGPKTISLSAFKFNGEMNFYRNLIRINPFQ